MTLPKKTRLESLLEWGYRHKFIVPLIMRSSFKARTSKSPVVVDWKRGVKLLSIGNSHIDAAWLWRKDDTRKKKINVTFDRALLHMSMYPEFTYTQNQAVYYAWIKENYPDIWAGIKQRYAEGRWEVLGGDWVECDANIPSVESLVRQRMAGQRFFLDELGFVSDIAWADDVFGFPRCYPQVLAKSGAKYFYTNKFCYNEVNKFPYHAMTWKSPDGSSVLLYWMQHKNSWAKWLKSFNELAVLLKPGEAVELDYMADFDKARASFSAEVLPIIGNMYGQGDGGNGPWPVEIIEQLCWHHQGFSKLGTTAELFAMLEPYRDRLPTWNDELYLECHQGTLTSIHMIKENNRTAEVLLHAGEYLNVANVLGGGTDYQPEIREIWKGCLFNQFHDVLPGSSIPEVYRDAAADYQSLFSRLFGIREAMSAGRAEALGNASTFSLTIINPLSWARGGIVTIGLAQLLKEDQQDAEGLEFTARDVDGIVYPCQLASFPHYDANREHSAGLGAVTGTNYQRVLDGNRELESFVHPQGKVYLWILLPVHQAIPALGHRAFEISWKRTSGVGGISVPENPCTLQNGAVSVSIDAGSGKISLARGVDNLILVKGASLALYEDPHSRFDAWNLDPAYYDHPTGVPGIESAGVDHWGPVIKSVLLKSNPTQAGTVFYHRIYIVEGQPIAYHDILVNWQEDHELLKYKVEPTFSTDMVRCGMQVGSIDRVTVPKNRFTEYKAKYEYPVQQWATVKGIVDGKAARVTLLNRNKYGLFCRGSTMELSLLKAAEFEKHTSAATLDPDDPRPRLIDRGFWRLSVAIMANLDDDVQDDGWRAGEAFNTPFSSLIGAGHAVSTFIVDMDRGSTSITTIKMLDDAPAGMNPHPEWFIHPREGERWIIFRLAEHCGKPDTVTAGMKPGSRITGCACLDLLERVQARDDSVQIDGTRNRVSIQVRPHEIKTVAICVKPG